MICFTCFRVGKRQSARALQQRMQPKTDITNPPSWTGQGKQNQAKSTSKKAIYRYFAKLRKSKIQLNNTRNELDEIKKYVNEALKEVHNKRR